MHPKRSDNNNQIRVLGQRSIASSFTFRPPIQNPNDSGECDRRNKDLNKGSPISLSDFLNKKLHSSPPLPGKNVVKGKLRPFCSPFGSRAGDDRPAEKQREVKQEEERCKTVVDQVLFEQFKCSGVEIGDQKGTLDEDERGSPSTLLGTRLFNVCETGTSKQNDMPVARKRWIPNEGDDHKHTTRKHSLVLGGDLAQKRKGREWSSKKLASTKRPQPFYNHYGNGCGWWDSDMEGVDTEEVGFGEVWEGVGSVTYGGIDWH